MQHMLQHCAMFASCTCAPTGEQLLLEVLGAASMPGPHAVPCFAASWPHHPFPVDLMGLQSLIPFEFQAIDFGDLHAHGSAATCMPMHSVCVRGKQVQVHQELCSSPKPCAKILKRCSSVPARPSCSPVPPCSHWLFLSTNHTTAALALIAAEHLAAKVKAKTNPRRDSRALCHA